MQLFIALAVQCSKIVLVFLAGFFVSPAIFLGVDHLIRGGAMVFPS